FRFYTSQDLTTEITDLTVSPATTTTYYVTVSGDGVCENAPGDAAEVTVTVNPSATATDIQAMGDTICEGDSFTLSATSSTVTNPIFRFYTSQDLTTEITDLTVSPATTTTYYVTVLGDGVCENAPGDAAEVTVTVNITEAPITNNPNQSFCTTDNATLSSIEIEGEGILWYATENSISPLDPTIPLADGATYFASQTDPTTNCESVLRTPVMVFLTDCNTGDGLTIQKFAENEIVYAGDTFTYTISITNTNNTEITDVTITDELDARLMYVASSNSGQFEAGVVTWTIPTIAANSIVDITLWVSTASNLASGTQISNVAIVSSPDDPDSPKESDPEVVTVAKDVDLAITKTASASTVLAGGEFSYTISVANTGQSDATDLTITDALPVGLSFISADNGGVNNAGTISWTIPTLAAGASIDLMLTVMVNADVAAGTQISNVAIVSSPDDPDSPKESDPEVVTVEKDVDLEITKTASASTVLAGGEFSYTISVMNAGQSDATDLTITDALPVGLSFISADNGGVNNAGTISWTVPTLAAGASIDLTLTVMVDADVATGTQISNVAIVSSPDDPDSPKESDPEVVIVEKDVDLEITKTASASTVLAGGEFSYTISVTNTGLSDATDLTITDALPAGLSFISADNGGVNNAGTISWTIPTLAAGASIDLMLTVMVNADVAAGTQISNVAIVSSPDDPDSPKESDPEVVTIEKDVDLEITKTASASTVLAGGEFSYTISVTNTGQSDATDLTITDALPVGLSFISADNGGVNNAGTISWTIPTLAAGASIDLTITVMVNADVAAGTQISNVAIVSSPDDPDSPKESDPEVVTVENNGSLVIIKNADVESVLPGGNIVYTITLSNTGDTQVSSSVVTDALPVGLSFISADNGGVNNAGTISWTVPTLAAGASIDLTLTVMVNADVATGTQISNVAIVSSPGDPDSPKESDPEVVTVEKDVDLEITKTASASTVLAGGEFSYTISVANTGQSDATDLTITDALPAGLSFISADNGGVNNAGTISWTVPTLAAGASIDLNLTVMVNADVAAGTQISNVAIVSSPDDPDSPKESDPEVVTVEKDVDLEITKTASASTVLAGGEFSYTISVTNTGQSDATDLTITDALPAGLSFISADNGGVNNAGTISWTVPTLTAGASIDLMLTVMVNADVASGTQISNVAIVSSPDDPDSPKESDPEVVTVEKDVDLEITKTASTSTVLAGGEFSYTISIMNSGQSDAADLTITDALPSGLSFISADNSGVNNAGTISWTVPTLAAGASIDLMVTVMVNADVATGTQISNVAIVSSPDDPDSPKESDPEVVTVENNGSLVIIKNADVESVLPGEEIVYTIAVSNTGDSQVSEVEVKDTLADGLIFISASNSGINENGVITWNIPTLDKGETVELELVVSVDANVNAETLISNVAVVSSPDVPESPIESDPEVVRVRSNFNLVIEKVANQNTALAGTDITYTITITNTGESISPMYMVTDMLHEGLNFNSASNDGYVENGEVMWMMPPLAAGAMMELTLNVEIDESLPAGTEIENVAIFWLRNLRESPQPSQPAVVRVIRDENVSISKVASKDKVVPGEEFTYTITVSNSGQNSLSDLVIRDTLDNVLSFVSATQGGTANGQIVTWAIPELAGGASISLELNVALSADATIDSEVANTAYAVPEDDPDNPIPSDPEVIEVSDPQTFTIVKTPNVFEAYVGDEVIYTITVTNTSDISQEQLTVVDDLPQGLTFNSANMEGELIDDTVTWMIPSLGSGESLELLLTTTVNDEAITNEVIYNIAVVDSETSLEDPVESDLGDGVLVIEEEDEEPEEEETSISVIKWTDVKTVIVGQMIDYTILIENTGDVMAYDLLVVDSLPAGTMAMEVSPAGEISDNAVVWMMDSLDAGASIEVKIKLMTMEDKGPISNWVFISGRNFPDVSFGTEALELTNQVDLVLDKEVSGSLIQLNSIFEYKITLTNNSANIGKEVVVTDVLSPSVEYIGADVSSGTVSFNLENRTLTWSMLSINPQAVETITIRVKAIAEGTVSNTATAVSADEELEPTDNTDTVSHEQIEFEIPNVFTPNGDGINDAWVIKGLQEFFQQNELLIVNRWGVEVYRMDNYQNDWDGDNLNGGTYFYQFQLTDSQGVSHTMTGYVTIIK
ncbi:isopeptide-forming domain-containing fimbrial protein, partial [uncultured Algoriphagus sp.]|uniref:isopeptide-forming domain-containing fimbrial protein n=1 Tax=uncultured Algoriphagus sp. TaxID=417365 RepID=UPI0030EE9194